ncbi:MAG: tRNA lysidine(34) synthetase TilS [Desulfobulbaceae bacterium]|nr:tRNA lysidine(34) synthetase TilS [Desulfobulbaceae bacterium]
MHSLAHTLRQVLVEDIGLRHGSSLLLAVSGGPDSMAMLHLMASLEPPLGLNLYAAYIDHGLRPGESPQEWQLVQAACSQLSISSTRIQVDARAEAARHKLSLEHAARELRYQALERLQLELSFQWLVLAHTADDQVEELLLRILRGGSRQALAGMRLCSGTRIRPLLLVHKNELLAYMDAYGYSYCHDSSNDDLSFLRNRIRHHLLPLLEQEYDAGVRRALLKCADTFAADEDLLGQLQEQAWNKTINTTMSVGADGSVQPKWVLNLPSFVQLHPALQRRVLERLLYTAQGKAVYEHIMALHKLVAFAVHGKELHLSQGLRALVDKDTLVFTFPWGKGATRRSCKAE